MAIPDPLRTALEHRLRLQLEKYQCASGEVRYQPAALTALQGIKADGSEKLMFLTDRELGILLSDYCDSLNCVGLIAELDLAREGVAFHPLSDADIRGQARAWESQKQRDAEEKIQQWRLTLQARTRPYGETLAEAVAAKLQAGEVLGHAHRDYCGMGLAYQDGRWRYGELWDGVMQETVQQWTDRDAFVAWLASRSDASLANLDRKDAFYWGNQTLDHDRLQAWVGAKD